MVLNKLKNEAEIALRHLSVLKVVLEKQPIGIFKLSEILNMPKHKVRYSLRVLEQSGIIAPTHQGAVIRENGHKKIEELKKEIEEVKKILNEIEEIIKKM